MRLIDADALIKKYGDWYVEEGTESGFIGTLKNLLATEPTIQPQSTDLIDRQAVIDELRKFKPEIIPYEKARRYVEETVETMHDRIVELPSIQPEPHEGRFERKRDGVFCSVCHYGWEFITGVPAEVEREYHYCPNCGADMRGKQDG